MQHFDLHAVLIFFSVRPPLQDPASQVVYVTLQDLFQSLKTSSTGISSLLHIWDSTSDTFSMRDVGVGKQGVLVIIGKDEVITSRSVPPPGEFGCI